MSLDAASLPRAAEPYMSANQTRFASGSSASRIGWAAATVLTTSPRSSSNTGDLGRLGVGLVVLPMSNRGDIYQPARREAFQLPLHGSRSGAGQGDELGGEEAAGGLAEQQTEQALPGSGEQGVGDAVGHIVRVRDRGPPA